MEGVGNRSAGGGLTPGEFAVYGGPIKVMGEYGDTLKVGGPGVIFDDPDRREEDRSIGDGMDSYGTFFTADTYFGKKAGDGVDPMFHHGYPLLQKYWGNEHRIIPQRFYDFSSGLAGHRFTNAIRTELFSENTGGIMATLILDMRQEYEEWIAGLVKSGSLSWSSGAVAHMVDMDWDTGEIKEWPIGEFSFTPTPAEPRTAVHVIKKIDPELAFKAFKSVGLLGGREAGGQKREQGQDFDSEVWYLNEMLRFSEVRDALLTRLNPHY